jgi:hypothetical protein
MGFLLPLDCDHIELDFVVAGEGRSTIPPTLVSPDVLPDRVLLHPHSFLADLKILVFEETFREVIGCY